MKTEAQMHSEAKQISRAIDNYTPLTQNNTKDPQTNLEEATK